MFTTIAMKEKQGLTMDQVEDSMNRLTVRYLQGEINLDTYQTRIAELNAQTDLRELAIMGRGFFDYLPIISRFRRHRQEVS